VSEGSYRLWDALTHEVLRLLCDDRPSLRHHPIVRALLEHTRGDWINWRTELTLRDVDAQIAALHQQWSAHDAPTAPVITDNGTELRIHAPWFDPAPYARDAHEPPASNPPS
jgi:hypothetical protein